VAWNDVRNCNASPPKRKIRHRSHCGNFSVAFTSRLTLSEPPPGNCIACGKGANMVRTVDMQSKEIERTMRA
jgi:hypothetical protein